MGESQGPRRSFRADAPAPGRELGEDGEEAEGPPEEPRPVRRSGSTGCEG